MQGWPGECSDAPGYQFPINVVA